MRRNEDDNKDGVLKIYKNPRLTAVMNTNETVESKLCFTFQTLKSVHTFGPRAMEKSCAPDCDAKGVPLFK
jgi:hypothetical protein